MKSDYLTYYLNILISKKNWLKKKYPISELALFGSVTRDDFNKESDIDILVDFDKPVGIEFIELGDELEKILNRKVDLVSKKAVKAKYFKALSSELVYV